MIQVYTGKGKGKTTAALGLALRAAGAGLRVYIAQFAKGQSCSELKSLKKIKGITIEQFGSCRFIKRVTAKDIAGAKRAIKTVATAIQSRAFEVVVLDEVNVALKLNLFGLKDVLSIIKKAPKKIEIILTGRDAPKEILHAADLVSEVREIKHYFQKGIPARKGIEF